jgi:hypothetical protein
MTLDEKQVLDSLEQTHVSLRGDIEIFQVYFINIAKKLEISLKRYKSIMTDFLMNKKC